MVARRSEDKTDVDLILEEISKRLKRIEQATDKTLRNSARQGKIDTAPVGIRAALKQKMIRGIFGNYLGSAIIRKGEKKRMDRELMIQREEELQHQRDLEGIKQTSTSETFSKDVSAKIEDLMIASQKISKAMSSMNDNILKISTIVVAIQKRVSPRDVNIGEDKKIRYDPLAPSGYQYSEVTESGKSGRIATGAEASRAAFSASRQMAKEAVEDTKKTQTAIPDEYSQERADIAKSEKIDMPTEDVNAKRYEKIQETLDEIKEKLEGDGFFSGLLKAVAAIGIGIVNTLMSAIGSIITTVGAIAAALGIKQAAKAVGAAVLGRALAKKAAANAAEKTAAKAVGAKVAAEAAKKAGAKAVGAKVAAEVVEKTAAKAVGAKVATEVAEKAATKPSLASKVLSKIPVKWKPFLIFLEKKSPALFAKFMARMGGALAGLAIPGPGWIWTVVSLGLNVWTAWEIYQLYQIFTGQSAELDSQEMSLEESEQPKEEQPLTPTKPPATVPAYQRPEQKGVEMDKESREMYDGKEDKRTNEIKTIVLPTPVQQPMRNKNTDMSVTIKVRNTEPSLATYRASIFDHPVTHPGNYMI